MAGSTPSRLAIAVAGAGIGGLTAAISLAKRGFNVNVYEQATDFHEIGAGIQLSPNAIHVLRQLDVEEDVLRCGIEPEAIDIRVAHDGDMLASIALKDRCRSRYGAPYVVIHRADLLDILLAAANQHKDIAISPGSAVTDVSVEPESVCFGIGQERLSADLLIAADGVHSQIRSGLIGRAATATSQTAWRATLREPCYDEILPADRTGLWLGNGVHLVHYALRGGEELNLVLISHSASGGPDDLLARFHAPVRQRLARADWLPWPLLRVDPEGGWYKGRVALLGDAAHAMLPTSAQGGAQAIEDAYVLGRCLEKFAADSDTALRTWQTLRQKRVKRIAAQAADNLRIYGLTGGAALARNLAIRMLPGRLHLSRLDWIYGWRPD